jgi:hypothetical protein
MATDDGTSSEYEGADLRAVRPYVIVGDADAAIWTPRRGLDALPSVFLKAAKAGLSNLL